MVRGPRRGNRSSRDPDHRRNPRLRRRRGRRRAALAGPRRTRARGGLLLVLYFVLPPTTFFNLAAIDFDANLGGGIAIGWLATAIAAAAAWAIGSRLLHAERP